MSLTDKRLKQLSELCRWRLLQNQKISDSEQKLTNFGTFEYEHNAAAHAVLSDWYKEKEAALQITQDEWDEYECGVEFQSEQREFYSQGEHLR